MACVALTLAAQLPCSRPALAQASTTVVADPSHHCVITQANVGKMLQANAQAAHLFGLAPPRPDLTPSYTAALKSMYPGFDDRMKTTMANAARNLPQAMPYLLGMSRQQLAAFEAPFRKTLDGAPDEASRQVMLTQVLAYAGQHGGGAAGSPAMRSIMASRLREQGMMQNMMVGASRSFSPSCNVYTGTAQANPTFCQPH